MRFPFSIFEFLCCGSRRGREFANRRFGSPGTERRADAELMGSLLVTTVSASIPAAIINRQEEAIWIIVFALSFLILMQYRYSAVARENALREAFGPLADLSDQELDERFQEARTWQDHLHRFGP